MTELQNARMKLIEAKAAAMKAEKLAKEAAILKEHDEYVALINSEDIRGRVATLCELANRCLENGIELPSNEKAAKLGWGKGSYSFVADGFYHRVGFYGPNLSCACWHGDKKPTGSVYGMKIENGGACGPIDLFVPNGPENKAFGREEYRDYKCVKDYRKCEPRTEDMKRFLKELDQFEAAFYKWIDEM